MDLTIKPIRLNLLPHDIPVGELAANKADFELTCDGGGCISFTDEFGYLGSRISWDLTDNSDVQQRIGLASKAFGSLRKEIFCNQFLKEVTRVRLFTTIVINLLLWGCESWMLNAGQRQNLNVCFNLFLFVCWVICFQPQKNPTVF